MPTEAVSDSLIVQWWVIALALTVGVALVVAVLLELVVRSTRRIHRAVSDIWTGGKRIAGNTVTIALLHRTNHLAGALLASAGGIAAASGRIRQAVQKG